MDDVTTARDVTSSTGDPETNVRTTPPDKYDVTTAADDVSSSTRDALNTDVTKSTSETPSAQVTSGANDVTTATSGGASTDGGTTTILRGVSSTSGTESEGGESTTLSSGVPPVAIITGPPSTIPACSESFILSGRHSFSVGSQVVRYAWTATGEVVSEQLANALDSFNAEDSGFGNPDITLSNDTLGSESALYSFILTVTDEDDRQGSTTFDLTLSDEKFTVSISSRIDTTSFDRTQGFQLKSQVHFFDGCETTSAIHFAWSANMAFVEEALGIKSNSHLSVPANALPAATTVTFTVQACLADDVTVCASASQVVSTILNDIVAVIGGPSTRLVSVSSGDLLLDGSNSRDPSDLPGDLVYRWRCGSITTGGFDELPGVGGALEDTNSSILTINTDLLQPEVTYRCDLTVSKGERSATVETLIGTTALETIDVNLEIQGGATSVHADALLVAKCDYTSTAENVAVTWALTSSDGSATIPLNESALAVPVQTQSSTSGISVTVMTLAADILISGETYVIDCKLTNQDSKEIGQSSLEVNVYSKPTSCMFTVADYTALTEVTLVTSSCSVSSVYSPLLYAYYYVKPSCGERHQLSLPSTDPVVTVIGPDATNGTTSITFVVQVCDQVGSCSDFATTASVQPVTMVTASEFTAFREEYVSEVASSGNSITALQNLNTMVTTVRDTGSDAGIDDADIAQLQVDLLSAALSEVEGDSSAVKVLVDGIGAVSTPELEPSVKEEIADVITNILSTADTGSDPLGVTSLATILETTQQLHTQGVEQAKVSDIEERALRLLSKKALAGGDPVKVTTPDATYTAINTVPCGSIDLEASTASMDMGDEVCDMYSSWNCSDGSACLGVSIQTVLYDEGVDYVSSPSTDDTLASSVLKVGFNAPDTGQHIVVSNLGKEVTLSLRVSGDVDDNRLFTCKYWDASAGVWSTAGVTTVMDSATGNVQCLTNHFSDFVVTSEEVTTTSVTGAKTVTDGATTTIAPVGPSSLRIVMLVLLGLFVLALMVVFLIFSGFLLYKHHQHKVIKTDHRIILKEMRVRREERSRPGSRASTPRSGKVSPRAPAADGDEGKPATVPPSYGMEDPKIAWINTNQSGPNTAATGAV